MRVEQRREGEGLRRLHQPQRIAVERLADAAFGVDGLDGVGDRQRGDRRPGLLGGRDRARNEPGAGKGPRRVMDQDDVRFALGKRLKSGAHRSLPGGAAEDRRQKVETSRS